MKEIKWGIIGCGDVTEVKSGPAFSKIEGSSLYMVMRRNEEKLKDYALRHGVKKYSTNYIDLLQDNEINAVYIATPPNIHCFYTLEAARHKKDIYVEKPMAITVEDCKKMIDACRENGVRLYTAFYRRGHDKFKAVKKIVDTFEIGERLSFNYLYTCKAPVYNPERPWLMDKEIAGEGLLYDIGSHMIDIMQFIFGEFENAYGISRKQGDGTEISDIVSGVIKFKSGVQGSIQLSFNSSENKDEFTIQGEKGKVRFAIMSSDGIYIKKDGKEKYMEFEPMEHVQMPYIQEVIDDIRGNGNIEHEGIYGLRTQEVIEAFSQGRHVKF